MTPRVLGDLHLAALWRRLEGGARAQPALLGSAVVGPVETADVRAARVLGAQWEALTPRERSAVVDPVRRMSGAGRQHDSTTCGPSVLLMLAASGDPALAHWLVTGRPARGVVVPPELRGAPPERLAALAGATPAARFATLQRVLRGRVTTRAVLGLLPWPARFGTPPWTAARAARFPGVRFGHTPVDDRDEAATALLLAEVRRAVAAGVPVPLYTGGDVSRGWATAVPRHLVLAVGAGRPDAVEVWEPGSGRVVQVPHAVLLHGGRHPGLGGWSRWVWSLVPRLADSTRAGHDGSEPPSRGGDRA